MRSMLTPSGRRFRPRHCRLLPCRLRLHRLPALAVEPNRRIGVLWIFVPFPNGTLATMWQRNCSRSGANCRDRPTGQIVQAHGEGKLIECIPFREGVEIGYPHDMDHLMVLRDKIGRLREEIADIQQANEQFRRDGRKSTDAQVGHGRRNERLQAIQHELVRLADLGSKVVSTEQMREKHRTRLHLIKQKQAS
jgi:hypothetical protein